MAKWKCNTRHRTYSLWCAMRQRCRTGNASSKNHGDRGIRVCPEWDASYDAFVRDMGYAPDGMTMERNDNDGDYAPNNCRWATDKEQRLNKRNNRRLTAGGITRTVTEWAEVLGIPAHRVWNRLRKCEPIERVLSVPTLRPAVLLHGTLNGYNYHKCRCDECRRANTQDKLARKAKTQAANTTH